MNFSEEFKQFQVKTKNRSKERSHLYADLAEVIALILNSNFLTMVDFILRFRKEDLHLVFEDEEEVASDNPEEIGSMNAEASDKEEMRALEVFEQLEARSRVFGDNYPFVVEPGMIRLRDEIQSRHRLYLFLLASSNLDFVTKKLESVLTKDFELVSFQALKTYLASIETVLSFDKNDGFEGTTSAKITQLGKCLKVEVKPSVERIEGHGRSDGGLDLVGWFPFSDSFPNFISVFAQCACGKDWHTKQVETRRFDGSYFGFAFLNPIHAMFVPFGLVLEDKVFERDDLNIGTLLVDRARIVDLIGQNCAFVTELESNQLIERLIEYEDSLY